MTDKALLTAVVIAGQRHELVTPIEIHDGDQLRFQMKAGAPHLTTYRASASDVTVTIGTTPRNERSE